MAELDKDFIHFPLLTVPEAARYLGVGRKIVYQLIEFDEIRAIKDKGTVMIEKRSLELFRNSGKLT